MQKSVRTMWDVIRDVLITGGMLPKPARPSFQNDIRPIFERLSDFQWVNAGFAAAFGWGRPTISQQRIGLKAYRDDPSLSEMRRVIANHFRVFDRDFWSPEPWPWLRGRNDTACGDAASERKSHGYAATVLATVGDG